MVSIQEQALSSSRSVHKATHAVKIGSQRHLSLLIYGLIGFGIFLRIFHFVDNRALWTDELYLANSLIRMDFLELASTPLEYQQKGPVGFLWLVRLAVVLFGTGEMALRLVPLLCGIAALFVFLPVARHFLRPLGVVVALGVMALAPPLVYHSVEIKQYSAELLATVLLLYFYTRYGQQLAWKPLLKWGFLGSVVVWFAFSSIFVLAGTAFAVCSYCLFNKNWERLLKSLLPFSMWLVSFSFNYVLFISKYTGADWLQEWFRHHDAFMPLLPTSLTDLKWYGATLLSLQHYPLGFSWLDLSDNHNQLLRVVTRMSVLPLFVMAVGALQLIRKDRLLAMVLLFPCLLALLASGLGIYPFHERLIFFLGPLLVLLVAYGSQQVPVFLPVFKKWKFIIPVLLLIGPLINSTYKLIEKNAFGKRRWVDERKALLYLNNNYENGDMVYIYWNSVPAYRYYKEAYNLQFNAIEGKDVRHTSSSVGNYLQHLQPDLKPLYQGKRAWLVYNTSARFNIGDHIGHPAWYYSKHVTPGKMIQQELAARGRTVDTYARTSVHVVLFNLGGSLN